MTTTTTFQGMDPSAKNSSRVLRPPGGVSSISFGTDEEKPPARKNRMASNIFAEPDDPHAHRRNNPPGGEASGVLCGEPSAPLRRCHVQPPWKNSVLEEGPGNQAKDWNEEHAEHVENAEEEEQEQEEEEEEEEETAVEQEEQPPQPSRSTVPAPAGAPAARKYPPGGKSSLILG
ncbi:jupiter microtubule associated homolog 1-like [Scleropages formosus]|uniref:Jupiter microtubule associated homolog 1b n=1 Tax=Scleropages formosus TaxID=113540 RepID=A0A8C9R984_SCLFO|nr:jupiter microtubule associated homolog 1-like [Scleropages formosus]